MKVTFVAAGLFSLWLGTWEPLVQVSKIMGTGLAAVTLGWVAPIWLAGKAFDLHAKLFTRKELKRAQN